MADNPRIIVGIGGTKSGTRPLMWAVAEARRRGAELHAVRAWHDHGHIRSIGSDTRPHLLALAAQERIVASFDAAFGGVPQDVLIKLVDQRGSAAAVLRRYADRDNDLLVLGPSRQWWWPFGRTVHGCLRKARCAVVVIPPAAMAGALPVRKLLRELRRDMKKFEKSGL